MEDYAGDPQFTFGNKADDNMSDDENSFVNESPDMHGEADLEFCAQASQAHPLYYMLLMTVSILFWNVQGPGSPSFRRIFATLVKSYNPTIVVILEPRISGSKADEFIKKSGFDRSHRVEATGFSEGIWILWRSFFDVEIVFYHTQFIHLKISVQNVIQSWVTTVYASPNYAGRHALWYHLNNIAKSMHDPIWGGGF